VKNKKPVIGVTFDSQPPGGYSSFPWYALRENYCSSLSQHGAIPFPLCHDLDLVDSYLDMIDGLVITGGNFDVDPTLYQADDIHPTVTINTSRTAFEWAMVKGALKRDIPLLGICGGQQLLNVVLGGTLIQHIPNEVETSLAHEQPNPRNEPGHEIRIVSGTKLHSLVGSDKLDVNSAHHQAVKDLAPGCTLNALAPDGIIEGFEVEGQKFCLGIQWHPEFFVNSGDVSLFKHFVEATRG
jgi:putative glutamine amidotransferase